MKSVSLNPPTLASIGHRLSGIALALFLPFHFLLLGTALNDDASLQSALAFTDNILVKVAEWGLVVFLVIHLLFGIRILVLELTAWPHGKANRQNWILPMVVIAFVVGLIFWIRAI